MKISCKAANLYISDSKVQIINYLMYHWEMGKMAKGEWEASAVVIE